MPMRYQPTPFQKARVAAVAVQVALTLTALMGILAIVVDGGLLLLLRRVQQGAADSAALAYAAAKGTGATDANALNSALAIAAANGNANDGTKSLITPNKTDSSGNPLHGIWSPPISGNFKGKAGYVEVVLEYDQGRLFSSLLGTGTLPVPGRAVASWNSTVNYWGVSILALGSSGTDVTDAAAQITVPGPIISNSNISVNGIGQMTSTSGPIDYMGTASGKGYSPSPSKVTTATSDPLASLAAPDPSTLTVRSTSTKNINGGSVTLQPGVYEGGISIQSNATVTLNPGVYYLEGGGLTIQSSGTTVTGNGVLLYNGETNGATNNPASVGSITISGNANVQLTPMTSGTWQGISIFQDRNASAAMTLTGGSGTNIGGMIYAPSSAAQISGGSNIVPGTSFITNTLFISGNSAFTIPLPTVKVPIPGSAQTTVGLVE